MLFVCFLPCQCLICLFVFLFGACACLFNVFRVVHYIYQPLHVFTTIQWLSDALFRSLSARPIFWIHCCDSVFPCIVFGCGRSLLVAACRLHFLSVFGISFCSLVESLYMFLYLVIESVDYYLLEQILNGFTFLGVFVPFAVLVFFLTSAVYSGRAVHLWSLSTSLSSLRTSWSSSCSSSHFSFLSIFNVYILFDGICKFVRGADFNYPVLQCLRCSCSQVSPVLYSSVFDSSWFRCSVSCSSSPISSFSFHSVFSVFDSYWLQFSLQWWRRMPFWGEQ